MIRAKVIKEQEGLYRLELPSGEYKLTDQSLEGVEEVDLEEYSVEVEQRFLPHLEVWEDIPNVLDESYYARSSTRTIYRKAVKELTEYNVYDCNGECEKCICGVKAELTEKEPIKELTGQEEEKPLLKLKGICCYCDSSEVYVGEDGIAGCRECGMTINYIK